MTRWLLVVLLALGLVTAASADGWRFSVTLPGGTALDGAGGGW